MGKMEGKVVIITGGGKGIGFGLSTAFAKEGAKLVLTGRTVATLEGAKKELEEKYGVEVLTVGADGANEEQVQHVVEEAVKKFGKIDVLINNAQTSKSGMMLEQHSKEDFDLASYGQKHFGMYHGSELTVTLRAENRMSGVIFDRFGMDIIAVPDGPDHFTIKLPLVMSPQFFGWLFGLEGGVQLIAPPEAVQAYQARLAAAAAQYP